MDNPLLKAVASGLLAYSVHYVSVKAYDNFCVPDGLLGFVKGVLTTGSPVCQSVLFIVSKTHTSYASILLVGVSRLVVDFFGGEKDKAESKEKATVSQSF